MISCGENDFPPILITRFTQKFFLPSRSPCQPLKKFCAGQLVGITHTYLAYVTNNEALTREQGCSLKAGDTDSPPNA